MLVTTVDHPVWHEACPMFREDTLVHGFVYHIPLTLQIFESVLLEIAKGPVGEEQGLIKRRTEGKSKLNIAYLDTPLPFEKGSRMAVRRDLMSKTVTVMITAWIVSEHPRVVVGMRES